MKRSRRASGAIRPRRTMKDATTGVEQEPDGTEFRSCGRHFFSMIALSILRDALIIACV